MKLNMSIEISFVIMVFHQKKLQDNLHKTQRIEYHSYNALSWVWLSILILLYIPQFILKPQTAHFWHTFRKPIKPLTRRLLLWISLLLLHQKVDLLCRHHLCNCVQVCVLSQAWLNTVHLSLLGRWIFFPTASYFSKSVVLHKTALKEGRKSFFMETGVALYSHKRFMYS